MVSYTHVVSLLGIFCFASPAHLLYTLPRCRNNDEGADDDDDDDDHDDDVYDDDDDDDDDDDADDDDDGVLVEENWSVLYVLWRHPGSKSRARLLLASGTDTVPAKRTSSTPPVYTPAHLLYTLPRYRNKNTLRRARRMSEP